MSSPPAAGAPSVTLATVLSPQFPVGAFTQLTPANETRSSDTSTGQTVEAFTQQLRRGQVPLLHGCAVLQSCVLAAASQRYAAHSATPGTASAALSPVRTERAALDQAPRRQAVQNVPDSSAAVVMVPVGPFDSAVAPSLGVLQSFLSTYLGGVPVAVARPIPLTAVLTDSRVGVVGQVQLHAPQVLKHILAYKRPAALCYIGGSMYQPSATELGSCSRRFSRVHSDDGGLVHAA